MIVNHVRTALSTILYTVYTFYAKTSRPTDQTIPEQGHPPADLIGSSSVSCQIINHIVCLSPSIVADATSHREQSALHSASSQARTVINQLPFASWLMA